MKTGLFPIGIVLVLATLLAGCSNTDSTFVDARTAFFPSKTDFVQRYNDAARRKADVLKLALLDHDAASLILLDSRRDGIDTWITPDGATISTKQGMLVAMDGFGAGLTASDVDQPLSMILSGAEGTADRFQTYVTGNDETFTHTFRCEIKNQGYQDIKLGVDGSRQVRTFIFSEDCRGLDQSFQNLYWVIPSEHRIVQTSQWTGDFIGTIATQVVPR